MNESTVQAEIRCALSNMGAIVFRQQSGTFLTTDGKRMATVGVNGMSDLLAILPGGRSVWIETKRSSGGKKLQDQKTFIEAMKKQGCLAGFAKSVDELSDIMRGWEGQ